MMTADDPNFKGFRAPQYTQVPNTLFDDLLPQMDETELRVTLVAIRKTLGWHKTRDAISLNTFIAETGLSRQGVLDGIEKAKQRGTLAEVGKGKRGINIYELVISDDQSTELTSLTSRPVPVKSVDQSPAVTSLTSRLSKEKNINKSSKQTRARAGVVWSPDELTLSETFYALTHGLVKPHEASSKKAVAQNKADIATLITHGITPEKLTRFYSDTYHNGYTPSTPGEVLRKIGAWLAKQPAPAAASNNGGKSAYALEVERMVNEDYQARGLSHD